MPSASFSGTRSRSTSLNLFHSLPSSDFAQMSHFAGVHTPIAIHDVGRFIRIKVHGKGIGGRVWRVWRPIPVAGFVFRVVLQINLELAARDVRHAKIACVMRHGRDRNKVIGRFTGEVGLTPASPPDTSPAPASPPEVSV